MTRTLSPRFAATVIALLAIAAAPARAQSPLTDLPLEDLMRLDAGRVFGASERSQPVTEAPASVSFITAEDIKRYGYRTLADILHGVRGMYVTDDRNFSYLGARGFGKPGDYNSRILLLVNGRRVNDNIFGQAEIGSEFGLDPATFERVEIIRGPASALYGDSAFFAVVNVITRTGAAIGGASATMEVGSHGTELVRGMVGERLPNGVDFLLSSTMEQSDGVSRLYFPAFDTPETNFGIAEGLDGQHLHQHFGRLAFGNWTFTGAYGRRRKDVPTAAFGTVFNEQFDRQRTIDRHTMFDVDYARLLGQTRVAVQGSYNRFTYDGHYPYDGTPFGVPVLAGHNRVIGARYTVRGQITRPLPGRQVLVAGIEFIDNLREHQASRFIDPPTPLFSLDRSSTQQALFVQDELKFGHRVILNIGARYDRYETFDRVTPRTALIVMPSALQSFKYLYGRAFRAPNNYERNDFYFGGQVSSLRPELIDTHELVWEQYAGDRLRTSVSTYWYKADRLITLIGTEDPTAFFGTTYVNNGNVRAKGLEFEAQMRLWRGADAHMSWALQDATDHVTGISLPNSPRQMAKARFAAPLLGDRSSVALEVLGIGSRLTLAGNRAQAAGTANVTVIKPITGALEIIGTARNLFGVNYAVPASGEHLQETIPQNGRTFRVGLRVKLR